MGMNNSFLAGYLAEKEVRKMFENQSEGAFDSLFAELRSSDGLCGLSSRW